MTELLHNYKVLDKPAMVAWSVDDQNLKAKLLKKIFLETGLVCMPKGLNFNPYDCITYVRATLT